MTVFIGRRDVVSVRGSDSVSYLQGQISQDVEQLAVGESSWSLILQPQGKVDAWFRITRSATDSFLLDVDEGFGELLLARLRRFLLRVDVELDLNTWDFHAHSAPVQAGSPIVAPASWGSGFDVIGPDLPNPDEDSMSEQDYDERRIRAGVPAMGAELTSDTIPAEAGVVEMSVSFTKGCYTGQELVARMNSRGNNAPRRLRVVEGGGEPPDVGASLFADGSEIATVTSVAPATGDSPDTWVALAFVKRSALDLTTATVESGDLVTISSVPPESGRS